MSELSTAVDDYIALRSALGHKMELAARLLAQFAAYCEQAVPGSVVRQLLRQHPGHEAALFGRRNDLPQADPTSRSAPSIGAVSAANPLSAS